MAAVSRSWMLAVVIITHSIEKGPPADEPHFRLAGVGGLLASRARRLRFLASRRDHGPLSFYLSSSRRLFEEYSPVLCPIHNVIIAFDSTKPKQWGQQWIIPMDNNDGQWRTMDIPNGLYLPL